MAGSFSAQVKNEVTFTINKREFKVSSETPLDTSLSTFIRTRANLSGTKTMCEEGGCGACVVAVRFPHHPSQQALVHAVNSCLAPVMRCEGWDIVTIEGLGNQSGGYHKLQSLLAEHNGSQCGYCSPGMVLNMYSLTESNPSLSKAEVEKSFDGNLCRCTGYRPILEAFKSVATDKEEIQKMKCQDIEDMLKNCVSSSKSSGACSSLTTCSGKCSVKNQLESSTETPKSQSIFISTPSGKWYRATKKEDVFDIFMKIGEESYRFVAGNTAKGVYRDRTEYDNYIDLSGLADLKTYDVSDTELRLGANLSLAQLAMILRHVATSNSRLYQYADQLADHLALVANVPVRNVATLAGNLCIKKIHPEFPSDLFLLLETVGAHLVYEKELNKPETVSLPEFLTVDLAKALITSVVLPPLDQSAHVIRTFKIMPRAKNVYAYVNAGFHFKVDKEAKFKVLEKPFIVYGNISSSFIHASKTEQFLVGKDLIDQVTLTAALESLQKEIVPAPLAFGPSDKYRAGLSLALFYKCMLGLNPSAVEPQYASGASLLSRPLSSSLREYDTDKSTWPVNQPVPKLEAIYQCSGEAQYINDMPELPNELHGALVLTTVATGVIENIDPSPALSIDGVVAFYSAKDIPGVNNFTTGFPDEEPVFCASKVLHHGQPVGVILADSRPLALKAARLVVVQYAKVGTPVVDMAQVIESQDRSRIFQQGEITPTVSSGTSWLSGWLTGGQAAGPEETVTVTGSVELADQYHMTMELQTCLCVPVEDGMDVFSCTQWMEHVHNAISRVIALPAHRINMRVKRLGGAYGAKLTRSTMVAAQCAVAAHRSGRPVRLVLDLETNMAALGKRYPCHTTYKAEVNKATGKIVKLEGNLFEDAGWSENDPVVDGTLAMLGSAYDSSNWNVKGSIVKTDKSSSTWCRSPGSAEAIGTIEVIMDSIASATGLDPVKVRLANMLSTSLNPVPSMVADWITHTDFERRKEVVRKFNSENRWKQRGLSLVPMTYKLFLASRYNASVSIYAVDGTVAVAHGGIECGQGINTKVAQVCAHGLAIDMGLVQVKPTDIFTSPNNQGTGGSVTSESVCFAVLQCCKQLQNRLEPVRKQMPSGYTWQQLIQTAYSQDIKLNATHLFTLKDGIKDYDIHGVTVAEVEVDVLTGQHQVTRVDILEDAGVSLSPEIDIGQVEGAFVMGIGYYMMEKLVYDDQGKLLTDRTWTYYPPGPLDIPVDFRIELRKNAPNPVGVLRSKATGEPPLCMSISVPLAVCSAISQTATQAGGSPYVQAFKTPLTPENTFLACNNDISAYKL